MDDCLYRRSCGYRVAVIWLYICLLSSALYAVEVPLAGRELDAGSASSTMAEEARWQFRRIGTQTSKEDVWKLYTYGSSSEERERRI